MNSSQIFSCLKRHKTTSPHFRGVFPVDMLIKNAKVLKGKNNSYVCNTAVKNNSGEHWVAIFISASGEGEFFDSYGFPPNTTFSSFLDINCDSWVRTNVSLQSPFTTVCGQFCVYFIHERSCGRNISSILQTLKNSDSDKLVNSFVNNHFSGIEKHALFDSRFVLQQIAKSLKQR